MQLSSPQKIFQKNTIPPAIIGLLPPMFAHHYTCKELDDLFIASFAPSEIPEGTKREKVKAWLRAINVKCEEPLEVLGNLLGDFMEKNIMTQTQADSIHHYMKKFYSYKKINTQL